jgi:hypothetical protein
MVTFGERAGGDLAHQDLHRLAVETRDAPEPTRGCQWVIGYLRIAVRTWRDGILGA